MGLDISFYSKLEQVQVTSLDEDGYCDQDHVHLYPNTDFPGREEPFEKGCYDYPAGSEHGGFRAGSYSGYNEWRDQLARVAGHASAESVWAEVRPGPFVELINFADNEGVLGTPICAKLAKDFADFDDVARANMDEYAYGKYREWRKAFETAADGGAVLFH